MNEWEAKYRALLMGISDQVSIDNAEKMGAVCVHMAATTPHTLEECYWMMARLVDAQTPLPSETAQGMIDRVRRMRSETGLPYGMLS